MHGDMHVTVAISPSLLTRLPRGQDALLQTASEKLRPPSSTVDTTHSFRSVEVCRRSRLSPGVSVSRTSPRFLVCFLCERCQVIGRV